MTVLVNEPRATFIHIPKTGGVSISRWLTANARGSYLLDKQHGGKHADQKRIAKYMKIKQMDMGYTFCVVRNPWDRLVSAYHYYIREDAIPRSLTFEQFVRGEWPDKKGNEWGCATKQMWQYGYKIDSVLRFENLEEDFKTIQDFFQINKPLHKYNKSQHRDYRTYYTSELVDIVAEKHATDIRVFQYTFE